MDTYSVANQKGGVGKTTVSVHQAHDSADNGEKVLFIDLDGQKNGSKMIKENCAHVWFDAVNLFDPDFVIPHLPAFESGIVLIEASSELNEVERRSNETALVPKKHWQTLNELGVFDTCIIDTPPALCLRLIAALAVSDYVLTPFELHGFSTDGIEELLKTIMGVRQSLNPDMVFLGMLPNKFDRRISRQKDKLTEMYAKFGKYMIAQPLGDRDPFAESTDVKNAVWNLKKSNARVAGKEIRDAIAKIREIAENSKESV